MTTDEIIKLAKDWSDEDYDNPTWIKYLNTGLDDLTPVAKILRTVSNLPLVIAADGSGSIALTNPNIPQSIHSIQTLFLNGKPIRKLSPNDPISCGWKHNSNVITIQNYFVTGNVTLKIDYYAKLAYVTDVAQSPELPSEYHSLLVLYMCAKSKAKEQELNEKSDFYIEYLQGKAAMAMGRVWDMEPFNRRLLRGSMVLGAGAKQ